jgi:endoglucanase
VSGCWWVLLAGLVACLGTSALAGENPPAKLSPARASQAMDLIVCGKVAASVTALQPGPVLALRPNPVMIGEAPPATPCIADANKGADAGPPPRIKRPSQTSASYGSVSSWRLPGPTAAVAGRLQRGINITAWFRFPASREPAALARYLSDQALADLRAAGFDFVRLAVDPSVADTQRAVLITAIQRIQRQGMTVVVSPHPQDWHLETEPERLLDFWRTLAPQLRSADPALTVPEVLNEPVFPGDPSGWARLQHATLGVIRHALPDVTVLLTGQDWGSIGGLLALTPEDDANAAYSFHFYDPSELTSLAAYRFGLDRTALARLPFPVGDRAQCEVEATSAADPGTRDLMRYYCAFGWTEARIATEIATAAAWARSHGVRLIAGEFGASSALNPAARSAWLHAVHGAFETHGIGWALWGYDDVMGLAVNRPPAPRPILNSAVLDALGLATPMSFAAGRQNR